MSFVRTRCFECMNGRCETCQQPGECPCDAPRHDDAMKALGVEVYEITEQPWI